MKFRQKVFLLFVIVIMDMILFGAGMWMWRERADVAAAWQEKQVNTGRISMVEEPLKGRTSEDNHTEAGRSERISGMSGQQENSAKKYVALTFDDGPNSKYTKPLLDGLRERGIRASFFLVGECIDGKEDLVRQMAKDGWRHLRFFMPIMQYET